MKNKKNQYIHEGMDQIANDKSLARHNSIGERLKLHLIKAEHIISTKEMHKGYTFCADLTKYELSHFKQFNDNHVLKYFDCVEKWKLLLEVILSSSKAEVIYKEQLAKKIRCSHKTLSKYINECVEAGFFIYLDPINRKIQDKRIVNLRPSEDTIVAYINYMVERMKDCVNLLKNHSKMIIN